MNYSHKVGFFWGGDLTQMFVSMQGWLEQILM